MSSLRLTAILTFCIVLSAGAMQGSTLRQGPRQYRIASDVTFNAPSTPDNWLGGTGNWSNPSDWSAGLPGSNSDVIINTGHDYVTLDTSASIQSLSLGGPGSNSSVLVGNRTAETLNVAGDVAVNSSANLSLQTDTMNIGGNLINGAATLLDWGSTMNIAGSVQNSSNVELTVYGPGGDKLNVSGSFTNNGDLYSNGPNNVVNIGGNLTNIGLTYMDRGSTINVGGSMQNSSLVQLTAFGPGGDKLNVTGTFTNNLGAYLYIEGPNDTVNFGSLVNHGEIELGPGSILNLTNQPGGITDIPGDAQYLLDGIVTAGGNNAFANLQTVEGRLYLLNGQTTVVTPGAGGLVMNGGLVVLNAASTLQINGNMTLNSASLFTSDFSPGGGNGFNVNGVLTIDPHSGVQMGIYGFDHATATGGIVNNGLLNLEQASMTTPILANSGSTYLQTNSWMIVGEGQFHGSEAPGYHQLASGVLAELIAPTYFGQLQSQVVSLDGTLDIQLLQGYEPQVGSTFKFILFQPGGLSGEFATIENDVFNDGTEKWVVNYDTQDGFVQLIAESNVGTTPEPGTLWLLSTGLLASTGFLRRGRTSGSPRRTRSARRLGQELK